MIYGTEDYLPCAVLFMPAHSKYVDEKMEVSSYMIFGPIFFASIGLKTNIDNVDGTILLFSLAFVVVSFAYSSFKIIGVNTLDTMISKITEVK